MTRLTVAIGGLGAIGYTVAAWLDQHSEAFRLLAVSAADLAKARERVAGFASPPQVVEPAELARADIVIEAAPAAAFQTIVAPAVAKGRKIIVASSGALLKHWHLVEDLQRQGGRFFVPSGALAGLDALRAAAMGNISSVLLETRKPPASLMGSDFVRQQKLDLASLSQAVRVFAGDALGAVEAFPANANVAASLALAGVGPSRTLVEIWADPAVSCNTHSVHVVSDLAQFTTRVESAASERNPRTSRLAPYSVIACLQGLVATIHVGS